ncbi:MAG: hypothetical protein LM590_15100 [Thermofilum sp.]|nr:hypothetical protein [Thermofilum sp.]
MLPGERVIERAIREMRVEGDWVYFGPLGRVKIKELERAGIPVGLYPASRRFTDFRLLLMRSSVLTIARKAVEVENALMARREEIPADVFREVYLAVDKIRFEALLLLKDVDERLFNVQYALYDVI